MVRHRKTHRTAVWMLQETSAPSNRAIRHHFVDNDPAFRSWMRTAWQASQRPFIHHLAGIILEDPSLEVVGQPIYAERSVRLAVRGLVADDQITHLISLYAPARYQARRQWVHSSCFDLFKSLTAEDSVIVAGDWNDVANISLDRLRPSPWAQTIWAVSIAPLLAQLGLFDAFRHLEHDRQAWSRVHSNAAGQLVSASRIDAAFATLGVLRQLTSVSYIPALGSDHHMLNLSLGTTDTKSNPRGPGFWHFHSALMLDPQYALDVDGYLNDLLQDFPVSASAMQKINAWYAIISRFRTWAIHSSFEPGKRNARKLGNISQLEAAISCMDLVTPADCQRFIDLRRQHLETQSLQIAHDEAVSHLRLLTEQRQPSPWLRAIAGDGRHFHGRPDDSHCLTTSRHEVNQFYSHLYTPLPPAPSVVTAQDAILDDWPMALMLSNRAREALDQPITIDEMMTTLEKIDPRSAPGPDGLPYVIFKGCAGTVAPTLVQVMQALWQADATFPDVTPLARGVLLWKKKGNRLELLFYRPLSIGNADIRIFSRLFARRLDAAFREVIMEEQTGFISMRDSIDNAFILNTAVWAVLNGHCQASTLVLFDQDQEKAYDRVNHDWLLRVLQTVGIGEKAINFVRNLYHHPHVQFTVHGYKCKPLPLRRGVLQGDPSSCLLYLLAYQPLMVEARRRGVGLEFGTTPPLLITGTSFADNSMVFLASSEHAHSFFQARQLYDQASESKLNEDSCMHVVRRPDAENIPAWALSLALTVPWRQEATEVMHLGRPLSLLGQVPELLYKDRIAQLRRFVTNLHGSQLHIFGRARFTNTFILSRLWRFTDMGGYPQTWLRSITETITPFLWRGTRAFTNNAFAYVPLRKGGLGVIDPLDMMTSMTGKWLCRLLLSDRRTGQLCRLHLATYVAATYQTDSSILLARRGRCWAQAPPNLTHHNTSLWGRVMHAFLQLELSLPPETVPWASISPIQAVALPFWMPAYFPNEMGRAAETWRTYYTRAHQGRFYSFADIFFFDDRPQFKHRAAWPIAIPHPNDLAHYHLANKRTLMKDPAQYWTALAWFNDEANFRSYWECLHPSLRDKLLEAATTTSPYGVPFQRPRPLQWPTLELPWHILTLATKPMPVFTVRQGRTWLGSRKQAILPPWPNTSPLANLRPIGWSLVWKELHRYPHLPDDARSAWWQLLHNRSRLAKTFEATRANHHIPCPRPDCVSTLSSTSVSETVAHAYVHCPLTRATWALLWPSAGALVGGTNGPFPPLQPIYSETNVILCFPPITTWLKNQQRMRFRLWYLLVIHALHRLRKQDINASKAADSSTSFTFTPPQVHAEWKRLLTCFLHEQFTLSRHFVSDWVDNSYLVKVVGRKLVLSF